jgi:hypothetical protein
LSQQTPPNFIALSFQSSLFSIVFCGSLFLGLFTAKVVSQSIYNDLFAANVQSFSVHGLFAAKVDRRKSLYHMVCSPFLFIA